MASMWGTGPTHSHDPSALHATISIRLAALDGLLSRLDEAPNEVSQRDLMQARSRTALACRLDTRLRSGDYTEREPG